MKYCQLEENKAKKLFYSDKRRMEIDGTDRPGSCLLALSDTYTLGVHSFEIPNKRYKGDLGQLPLFIDEKTEMEKPVIGEYLPQKIQYDSLA